MSYSKNGFLATGTGGSGGATGTNVTYASPSINQPQGALLRQYTFDSDTQSFTIDTGTLVAVSSRAQITSPGNANSSALEPSSAANVSDGEAWVDIYNITPDSTSQYDVGLLFRCTDASNHYLVAVRQGSTSSASSEFELYKKVAGTYTSIRGSIPVTTYNNPVSLSGTTPTRIMVRFVGSQISIYCNETFVLGASDTTYTTGRVGIRCGGASGGVVAQFDNLSVYSLASNWTPGNYTAQTTAVSTVALPVYASPSINMPQGTQQRQYTFDNDTQNWTVDAGTLTQVSGRAQFVSTSGNVTALEPSSAASISDGELYADLTLTTGSAGIGIVFRATDFNNHYLFNINPTGTASAQVGLYYKSAGTYNLVNQTVLSTQSIVYATNVPQRLFVRFVGSQISAYINEELVGLWVDTGLTTGRIGVRNSGATTLLFDNVTAYSLPSTWTPALYTPQSAAAAPQFVLPTLNQINYCEVTSSGTPTMTGQTFTNVLPFDTIVSDPGSNYSTANKWYTVPVTGTYQITMQFRCDAATNLNVGYAVATSNTDTTATVWRQDYAGTGNRHTYNYSHVGKYNAGDQLRAIAYIDQAGSFAFGGGYMAIEQIATAATVAVQPQQAWQTVSYSNSWVAYGSPYAGAGYYLGTEGVVHLRGLVKNGTNGATIFTLPAGYRPETKLLISTVGSSGSGDLVVSVIINLDGTVVHNHASANAYVTLDNISFRQFG